MLNRREAVVRGMAALLAGLASKHAAARSPSPLLLDGGPRTGAPPARRTGPFASIRWNEPTDSIGGYPIARGWQGDWFPAAQMPFHHPETIYPDGAPPPVSEQRDVVIVGGGLSGLATAYKLRRHRPVILELHSRFGGTSQGEESDSKPYSIGGAYFIAPDEGSVLEGLYRELGVDRLARVSPPSDDPTELNGQIDPRFWDNPGRPAAERLAFEQYRNMVLGYGERYPNIPLEPGADNGWIVDLDRVSLREHVHSGLTVPVPAQLQAAIQAYCYSSFNASWTDISAAAGWNFIAAEEFGRWVMPGGNAGLAEAFWRQLLRLERRDGRGEGEFLRASCRVVEVRVVAKNDCRVVYRDGAGVFRTIACKRVVMTTPKHVARHVLPGMHAADPAKHEATYRIRTAGYIVANVLLNRRVRRDFYDLFLLGNGVFPDVFGTEEFRRVTDCVNGTFALRRTQSGDVLTLYWPLPFPASRVLLIEETSRESFANLLGEQLTTMLGVLNVRPRDVQQVRLARWGHAMPIAAPGLIADGIADALRRPLQDHIFFVQADNWGLPAVETCLLEAEAWGPLIEAGL